MRKIEKFILRGLLITTVVLLPLVLIKKPRKDWIIAFLLKGLLSSFLGTIVVGKKWVKYPVRILPKYFQNSVLFEYFLFPLTCVFYNQTTYKSNFISTIGQTFLYSIPMTVVEFMMERKTKLITYLKWTWYYTFFSLTGTLLLVRGMMGLIRFVSRS